LISLAVLAVIYVTHLDELLVGHNFIVTSFFILIALVALFNKMENDEEEIALLRCEIHDLAYGSPEEKQSAHAFVSKNSMILRIAKETMTKKYGLNKSSKNIDIKTDTRSLDPFYISDKHNPNYKKMMDEKIKLAERDNNK